MEINQKQQPKSLEDLNNLIDQRQKQKDVVWPHVIGSTLLPPFTLVVALYLAWRQKVLYLALPSITILWSILTGFSVFLIYSASNPVLLISQAFSEKKTSLQNNQIIILAILTIILAIIGVIAGFYFRNKARKESGLATNVTLLLIIILVLQFLIEAVSIYRVNSWIYQQVSGQINF